MKKNFFIYELHIFNLPLALVLKLFGNVSVQRYSGLCRGFIKTSFFSTIADFKDIDQWVNRKEEALDRIRKYKSELEEKAPNIELLNSRQSLTRLYLQKFSIDYEAYLLFLTLVGNSEGPKVVLDFYFHQYIKKTYPSLIDPAEAELRFINTYFLESGFALTTYLIELLKLSAQLFRFQSSDHSKQFKFVCAGISASEIPSATDQVDFSWLVQNKVISANEVIFLIDQEIDSETEAFLMKRGIQTSSFKSELSKVELSRKVKLLLESFWGLSLCIFGTNYLSLFALKTKLRAKAWAYVLSNFNPHFFIFSFSCGWPEIAGTLSAKALKVKTIMWFYSSGEFLYSTHSPHFKDLSIRFCIFETDEIWVWNRAVKELFVSRLLDSKDATKIFTVGPILNGDWGPLVALDANVKRPFTVSVFDLTPMKTKMRLQFGEGPFCNTELQEKFFQGIYKAYQKFPDLHLIIKAKRNYNSDLYEEVPTYNFLVNSGLPRIQFMNANTTPYYAISKSDLVISTPFTSPTILAQSLGRAGYYYDPLGMCNYSFQNIFHGITIESEDELLTVIQKAMNNNNEQNGTKSSVFEVTNPHQMLETLRGRLK